MVFAGRIFDSVDVCSAVLICLVLLCLRPWWSASSAGGGNRYCGGSGEGNTFYYSFVFNTGVRMFSLQSFA